MLSTLVEAGRNLFTKKESNPHAAVLQRRRNMRFNCHTGVHCVVRQQATQGQVLDVSAGGVRLQVGRELRKGAEILLKPDPLPQEGNPEAISIPVRIVWVRRVRDGFEIGAAFSVPAGIKASWIGRQLRQVSGGSGLSDKRSSRRYRTQLPGGLRLGTSSVNVSLPGNVVDISLDGALFAGNLSAEAGTPILLKVGTGEQTLNIPGRVIRVRAHGNKALVAMKFDALPYAQRCSLVHFLGGLEERASH
ncbi:MAG: PilZ domain-containing protein [Candidatus Xenobia bacterium]